VTLLNVIKSTSIARTSFDPGDLDSYQGMPVGFTQAGYPYLGDSDAPVTLEESSIFPCPLCAHHTQQIVPALVEQFLSENTPKRRLQPVALQTLNTWKKAVGMCYVC
jgi:hypothetical protein